MNIYIYIYIYIYMLTWYIYICVVHSISFQTFFVHANGRRLLKIQYVIAIHLMRWRTNFYDFAFKWTATAAIGIHPTTTAGEFQKCNLDVRTCEEERYAIKFCFKLGKNVTLTYGMLQTILKSKVLRWTIVITINFFSSDFCFPSWSSLRANKAIYLVKMYKKNHCGLQFIEKLGFP